MYSSMLPRIKSPLLIATNLPPSRLSNAHFYPEDPLLYSFVCFDSIWIWVKRKQFWFEAKTINTTWFICWILEESKIELHILGRENEGFIGENESNLCPPALSQRVSVQHCEDLPNFIGNNITFLRNKKRHGHFTMGKESSYTPELDRCSHPVSCKKNNCE